MDKVQEIRLNPETIAIENDLMAKFGTENFTAAIKRAQFRADVMRVLRQRRISKNMDQKELARLLNAKQQQISRYENCDDTLSLERLYDYIQVLDLEIIVKDRNSEEVLIHA